MYKGKHLKHEKPGRWIKSKALLVSLLLVIGVTVGGTLAYIVAGDGPVENTFTPSMVSTYVQETVSNGKKTEVKIENTGDTTAYIRAAVVVTWQDKDGNVYGQKPVGLAFGETSVEGADYDIVWSTEDWAQGADGFYYYLSPVAADGKTEALITSCAPVNGKAPDGYSLAVEIISSGIQAEGQDSKGNKPIELAWSVDIDGGKLKAATIAQ